MKSSCKNYNLGVCCWQFYSIGKKKKGCTQYNTVLDQKGMEEISFPFMS